MAIELEKIKAWDGQSGTGADARGVIDRNFEKVKDELEAVDAKFSDVEDEIVQLAGELDAKANHGYDSSPKTLKEVDEELSELQSSIGYIIYKAGSNLLQVYHDSDKANTVLWGTGYLNSNGEVINDSIYIYSKDYIAIPPITYETFEIPFGGGTSIVFYDAKKVMIEAYRIGDITQPFTPPIGATYFRFSFHSGALTSQIKVISSQDYAQATENVFAKRSTLESYVEKTEMIDDRTEAIQKGDSAYLVYSIEDNTGKSAFSIDVDGTVNIPKLSTPTVSPAPIVVDRLQNNNLRNQENLLRAEYSNYGSNKGVYTIPLEGVARLRLKLNFLSDINNNDANFTLLDFLDGESSVRKLVTENKAPEIFRDSYGGKDETYVQQLAFKSGLRFGNFTEYSDSYIREKIVGEPLFFIWLKGYDASEGYKSTQELIDRANSLSAIQDYCLNISDNRIEIIRDGIGEDESAFNGGQTSTLLSVEMKSGGEWRSLKDVYEELKVACEPLDIYVDFKNLSARKDASDILQFGKVKLVGKYYQQIEQGASLAFQDYYYDSYPVIVYSSVDEKTHLVDIVIDDGVTVFMNGERVGTKLTSKVDAVKIGNADGMCVFSDMELFYNEIGEAEVIGSKLISDETPIVVGLMLHQFDDQYEGSTPSGDFSQSVTRIQDVIREFRKRGYTFYNAKDIALWASGAKKLSKRSAYMISDDRYLQSGYMNSKRARNSYEQYGVPMNFALVVDEYYNSENKDELTQAILRARLNGHDCVSHSKYHDVPMPQKNSLNLAAELIELQDWCESLGMTREMFVYNWSGSFAQTWDLLKLFNINCAVHSGWMDTGSYTSKYYLGRKDISDTKDFNTLISSVI